MKTLLPIVLFFLFFISSCSHPSAQTTATKSFSHSDYVRSVVFVSRSTAHYPVGGSAWFYTNRHLVTAGHILDTYPLSQKEWTKCELVRQAEASGEMERHTVQLRLLRQLKSEGKDDIAILELREPFLGAQVLQLRHGQLSKGEKVYSVAYPHGYLCLGFGHACKLNKKNHPGLFLCEMFNGKNRRVLDFGASGSPILDSQGRVVAITSIILQIKRLFSDEIIVAPAGRPNSGAIPVAPLLEFGGFHQGDH